jgi:hypothetical protein
VQPLSGWLFAVWGADEGGGWGEGKCLVVECARP